MIYLIADLHLNHANIIKYCNRPFRSVQEMNSTIIRNWNNTVNEDDFVYLVGDLASCKRGLKAKEWAQKLNGTIMLIRGNHDRDVSPIPCRHFDHLSHNGYNFLLVHSPHERGSWRDWMIHGHVHNGKMEKYPLINVERKTVNVGVELLNYTPISIDSLIKKIERRKRR